MGLSRNDKFEGFSMKNSSWDIAGDYEVIGYPTMDNFYKTEKINEYQLSFRIYVDGMYIML